MRGSVKYQVEGAKMTIETGVQPSGRVTRQPMSDYHYHNRDERGNLISIEVFGLGKIARSENALNLGEWDKAENPKRKSKNSNNKGGGGKSTKHKK